MENLKPKHVTIYLLLAGPMWMAAVILALAGVAGNPEGMAAWGQAGDVFGVLNSLFGLIAGAGALTSVIFVTKQLAEQRALAKDQKVHTAQNLMWEKLEQVLMGLRRFMEVVVSSAPTTDHTMDLAWLDQYVTERVAAIAPAEILSKLHFPEMARLITSFMDHNTTLTNAARTVVNSDGPITRQIHFFAFKRQIDTINRHYQNLLGNILTDSEAIVAKSPAVVLAQKEADKLPH